MLVMILAAPTPAGADVPGAMGALASGDCKAAAEQINEGLARDDAQANFLAGYLYDRTPCVDSDPARAAGFYRRAIARGDTDAAVFLGLLYGLGRGVPQDYALAHLAFTGHPATALDAASDTPDARAAGYAETIAYLAKRRVDYPVSANRKGIEAAMDVVFTVPGGPVEFEHIHVDVEIGSSLARVHDFTDPIAAAYDDAMTVAPKPAATGQPARQFVTHWAFEMRQNAHNNKVAQEGFISVGETRPKS